MKKVSKSLCNIASKISERDVKALKSIYDLRCLTDSQIYQLHYSVNSRTNKPVADTFCKSKITTFIDLGLIERVPFKLKEKNLNSYFLTTLGVDLIRAHFNLPHNIFDSTRKVVQRGYLRPSELKINSRLIPHQIYLNQFYIDFTKLNCNLTYSYKDAKHSKAFYNIAPDAILTAKDTYYFIETDLGTENKKLLSDKWKHYRRFLQSSEFTYLERKVVVLFILENVTDIEQRKDLVKLTAYEELLDLLDDNFDIYVGTRDTIIQCLSKKLLITSKEMSTLPIAKLSEILANNHSIQTKPACYFTRYNPDLHKYTYLSKLDTHMSFDLLLIDDYHFEPLSVFNKIAYFERTKDLFYNNIAQRINLLIIVDSIETLYNDLLLTNLTNLNIFFSTIERLENLSFENALFQLDLSGNFYTFNFSLNQRLFSHNILDI